MRFLFQKFLQLFFRGVRKERAEVLKHPLAGLFGRTVAKTSLTTQELLGSGE
jgi:hypothetical protein